MPQFLTNPRPEITNTLEDTSTIEAPTNFLNNPRPLVATRPSTKEDRQFLVSGAPVSIEEPPREELESVPVSSKASIELPEPETSISEPEAVAIASQRLGFPNDKFPGILDRLGIVDGIDSVNNDGSITLSRDFPEKLELIKKAKAIRFDELLDKTNPTDNDIAEIGQISSIAELLTGSDNMPNSLNSLFFNNDGNISREELAKFMNDKANFQARVPALLRETINRSMEGRIHLAFTGEEIAELGPFSELPNKVEVVAGSIFSFFSPLSISTFSVFRSVGGFILAKTVSKTTLAPIVKTILSSTGFKAGSAAQLRFATEAPLSAMAEAMFMKKLLPSAFTSGTSFAGFEGALAGIETFVEARLAEEDVNPLDLAKNTFLGMLEGFVLGSLISLAASPGKQLTKSITAKTAKRFGFKVAKATGALTLPLLTIPPEVLALATVGALMEGRIPNRQDMLSAFVFVSGFKVVGLATRGITLGAVEFERGVRAINELYSEANAAKTKEMLRGFVKEALEPAAIAADSAGIKVVPKNIPAELRKAFEGTNTKEAAARILEEVNKLEEVRREERLVELAVERKREIEDKTPTTKELAKTSESPADSRLVEDLVVEKPAKLDERVELTLLNPDTPPSASEPGNLGPPGSGGFRAHSNSSREGKGPHDLTPNQFSELALLIKELLIDRSTRLRTPLTKGQKVKDISVEAKRALVAAETALRNRSGASDEARRQTRAFKNTLDNIMKEIGIYGFRGDQAYRELAILVEAKRELDIIGKGIDATTDIRIEAKRRGYSWLEYTEGLIADIEAKLPGIEKVHSTFNRLMKENTIDLLLEEGHISPRQHAGLKDGDPNYAPRYIMDAIQGAVDLSSTKGGVYNVRNSGLEPLTDGMLAYLEKDPIELFSAAVNGTQGVIAANRLHIALRNLAEGSTLDGMLLPDAKSNAKLLELRREFEAISDPSVEEIKNFRLSINKTSKKKIGFTSIPVIVPEIDGLKAVRQNFMAADKLVKSLAPYDTTINNLVARALSLGSGTAYLRFIATGANPEFALTDLFRNMNQAIMASSVYGPIVPVAYARLVGDMKSVAKDAFAETGIYIEAYKFGLGTTFASYSRGILEDGLSLSERNIFTKFSKNRDVLTVVRYLAYFGEKSEILVRLAHYKRARDIGMAKLGENSSKADIDRVRADAAASTRKLLDFSTMGTAVRVLNNLIPYLSSSIGAISAIASEARKNKVLFAIKAMQINIGLSSFQALMSGLFPDVIDNVPDKIKARSLIIPLLGASRPRRDPVDGSIHKSYFYLALPLNQTSIAGKALTLPIDRFLGTNSSTPIGTTILESIPITTTPLASPIAQLAFSATTGVDPRGKPINRGRELDEKELYGHKDPYLNPAAKVASRVTKGIFSPYELAFTAKTLFPSNFLPFYMLAEGARWMFDSTDSSVSEVALTGGQKMLTAVGAAPFTRRFLKETGGPNFVKKAIAQAEVRINTENAKVDAVFDTRIRESAITGEYTELINDIGNIPDTRQMGRKLDQVLTVMESRNTGQVARFASVERASTAAQAALVLRWFQVGRDTIANELYNYLVSRPEENTFADEYEFQKDALIRDASASIGMEGPPL